MKKDDDRLLMWFRFLDEERKTCEEDADKVVWIEHCINMKELSDFVVTCPYGDMVLIICMIRDYLKMLEGKTEVVYDYYKQRFRKMADRMSAQIGYNYDAALERCMKKSYADEHNNDVGEDALNLALKYAGKGKKKEQTSNEGIKEEQSEAIE